MSLNLNDLNLIDTIRDIIGDLNAGVAYIVRPNSVNNGTSNNPFDTSSTKQLPELVEAISFISFKNNSTKYNEETGIREGGYHSVKLAKPQRDIEVDDLVYLDFSEGAKVVTGVVDTVSISISSIVELRIKDVDVLPYTWAEIQTLIP